MINVRTACLVSIVSLLIAHPSPTTTRDDSAESEEAQQELADRFIPAGSLGIDDTFRRALIAEKLEALDEPPLRPNGNDSPGTYRVLLVPHDGDVLLVRVERYSDRCELVGKRLASPPGNALIEPYLSRHNELLLPVSSCDDFVGLFAKTDFWSRPGESSAQLLHGDMAFIEARASVRGTNRYHIVEGLPYRDDPIAEIVVTALRLAGLLDDWGDTVSARTTYPERIHHIKPQHPDNALENRIEGKVILSCVVDEEGSVRNIQVEVCNPPGQGFEEAAVEALRQWRYEPGSFDGKPVPWYLTVRIDFTFGRPEPN